MTAETRAVARCVQCGLNQFRRASGACCRCRAVLPVPAEKTEQTVDAPEWIAALPTLAVVERAHVEAVLAAFGGHVVSAARHLGLGRQTIYRKLREWKTSEARILQD